MKKIIDCIDLMFQEWTPDFSKYIPNDSAVLFLSEEDMIYFNNIGFYRITYDRLVKDNGFPFKVENPLYIIIKHGTQAELQKANNVAKELKEKYGVEEVNLFVLHCFIENPSIFLYDYDDMLRDIGRVESNWQICYSIYNLEGKKIEEKAFHITQKLKKSTFIDQLITTNSTGILEVREDTERRLKVVDWKKMVKDVISK